MKKIIFLSLFIVTLTGCSIIELLPKKHDPAGMLLLVDLRVNMDYLSCTSTDDWEQVKIEADKLALYTSIRGEPQAENAANMRENISTASNLGAVCTPLLNVAKTKADIIIDAWGGRK